MPLFHYTVSLLFCSIFFSKKKYITGEKKAKRRIKSTLDVGDDDDEDVKKPFPSSFTLLVAVVFYFLCFTVVGVCVFSLFSLHFTAMCSFSSIKFH